MTKKIAGVLLDFDGVIVDSFGAHLNAWQAAYEKLFSMPLELESLEDLTGRSSKSISLILAQRAQKYLLADQLMLTKMELLTDQMESISLLPGALDFIAYLDEVRCPYGIVSNANRAFIKKILASFSITVPFFTGIEDYDKPKPHPQPYIRGAARMGMTFQDYKDIAVFEDSLHGLKAAAATSMFSIGITSQHSDETLLKGGAQLTFPHLGASLESGLLTYT